jgi:hypothetical protein
VDSSERGQAVRHRAEAFNEPCAPAESTKPPPESLEADVVDVRHHKSTSSMPIPLGKRAARVQACSLPMGRQGVADTLVARRLHGSCTGSCTLLIMASLTASNRGVMVGRNARRRSFRR